jgi:hypothetical protein
MLETALCDDVKLKDDREKVEVLNFDLPFHLFHQRNWSSNWKGQSKHSSDETETLKKKGMVKNQSIPKQIHHILSQDNENSSATMVHVYWGILDIPGIMLNTQYT